MYKRQDLKTGEVTKTGLPASNVLYYELSDNAWCCVRPSGTCLLYTSANTVSLPGYGNSMIAEFAAGVVAFLFLCLFGYVGILKEKGKGFIDRKSTRLNSSH